MKKKLLLSLLIFFKSLLGLSCQKRSYYVATVVDYTPGRGEKLVLTKSMLSNLFSFLFLKLIIYTNGFKAGSTTVRISSPSLRSTEVGFMSTALHLFIAVNQEG